MEKLKKRSYPFFEPPMAVKGSKPPEAKCVKNENHTVLTRMPPKPDLKSRFAALDNPGFFDRLGRRG